MIPNMMSEWDGSNDPQSPTITFDIRFPFPNVVDSTSVEGQRSPGDFSFHLSIKMPSSSGSGPMVHSPVINLPSVDMHAQNAQDAQQLEITLKERLQQQRNLSIQTNASYQRPRCTESSKLPTPPSTSHSERLSPIDGAEISTTGEIHDGMDCDAHDRQDDQSHSKPGIRTVSMKAAEKSLRDRTRVMCDANPQPTTPSSTKGLHYSGDPSQICSRSPETTKRSEVQREYRSRSRSYSPVESSKRGRSYSPVLRRSRSVSREVSRGRIMGSKRGQRSSSPNYSSRDTSQSRQSRSHSRGPESYTRTRARSTSTTSHADQLAVERINSTRYSQSPSPVRVQQALTPSTSSAGSEQLAKEISGRGKFASLQLRIGGERVTPGHVVSKHTRRRTCPFYHPTDKDRHPLDGPHPGYSVTEFEEAVNLYEKGCVFPPRLIKDGATVNPKNRQMYSMHSPTKGKFASVYQKHSLHSPSSRSFNGRAGQAARSRSPNESPIKRRKLATETPYHAQGSYSDNRVSSNYASQPAASFRSPATFTREGPVASPYEGKGRTSYYQNIRLGSNYSHTQRPKPTHGRQATAPLPNMGQHRWQ